MLYHRFCEKKLGYGVFELTNHLSGDVHAAGNMLTALALFIFKWYFNNNVFTSTVVIYLYFLISLDRNNLFLAVLLFCTHT